MTTGQHQPPALARSPRMTFRQHRKRTRQLDELRIRRGLTPAERAEADALAAKLYLRVYRLS